MKFSSAFALPILVATCVAALAGCHRYQFTLNEQVVAEPPRLLKGVAVADDHLQLCLEQAILDRQVHSIDGLDTLVCTNGGIRVLDGIEQLHSLGNLNLADNALSSVAPLLFLGKLKGVNLTGNLALDCGEVEKLRKHLPEDGTLMAPEHCGK